MNDENQTPRNRKSKPAEMAAYLRKQLENHRRNVKSLPVDSRLPIYAEIDRIEKLLAQIDGQPEA